MGWQSVKALSWLCAKRFSILALNSSNLTTRSGTGPSLEDRLPTTFSPCSATTRTTTGLDRRAGSTAQALGVDWKRSQDVGARPVPTTTRAARVYRLNHHFDSLIQRRKGTIQNSRFGIDILPSLQIRTCNQPPHIRRPPTLL